VTPLEPDRFDVGPGGFGDPQPVEGEERYQRVLGGGSEPSGHEESAYLVAIEASGVGLVVQARTSDVDSG